MAPDLIGLAPRLEEQSKFSLGTLDHEVGYFYI